jgi:hypothetical protein
MNECGLRTVGLQKKVRICMQSNCLSGMGGWEGVRACARACTCVCARTRLHNLLTYVQIILTVYFGCLGEDMIMYMFMCIRMVERKKKILLSYPVLWFSAFFELRWREQLHCQPMDYLCKIETCSRLEQLGACKELTQRLSNQKTKELWYMRFCVHM